jgi:hypothetical protein
MKQLTIKATDNEWYAVHINGRFNHETRDIISLTKFIGLKRLEGYGVHYE